MINRLAFLDELRTLARTGLHFATNDYDRERYSRLLEMAAEGYAELLDAPATMIQKRFLDEVGYITLKVGADAAIFNPAGEILLMERSDGTGWCLPCGWVDPNEKPIDAAIREAREETGLEVKVTQLVGVFTRFAGTSYSPHALVAVVHLCEVIGGELRLSHEGTSLRYWPIDEVKNWHATHDVYARAAYQMWKSSVLLPAISN